jgi:glycosyl hydrolase family 79
MTLAFVAAATIVLAVLAPGAEARERPEPRPLDVRVDPQRPGATIPRSFLGLSIEYPDLPLYTGSPAQPNELYLRLLGALAAYGNGAPTLRIGGNSGDQSWWNPAGLPRPANVFHDTTPQWIEALSVPVRRVGSRVVLGLNLALNDPANARAFAEAAISRLPPGAVELLEIGNEPDLYTRPTSFYVGRRLRQRPLHRPAYSPEQYLQELDAYVGALSPLGVPLGAGGFASAAWDARTPSLLDRFAGRIKALSAHVYPLRTCGAVRRRPPGRLIARLLANRRAVERAAEIGAVARSRGVAFRLSEANSTVCGGVKGVSDTFATALWATNALFGYMAARAQAVNLHTWHGAFYAPFSFPQRDGRVVARVRPLFYGMLLFARATAHRAQLLETSPRRARGLRIWATRNLGGTTRVVVVNTSKQLARRARIAIAGLGAPGTVERLTAPSLHAKGGIALAGKSYGGSTADAVLRGRHAGERVRARRGRYEVVVAPASAAMLTVRPAAPPGAVPAS